jgi:molybdopterin-binding protein
MNEVVMKLLKPREAAALMQISYPTLKQWIYRGKIRTIKTFGGHHRIPQSEIQRWVGRPADLVTANRNTTTLARISGRNKLLGTITEIKFDGLLAQVTLDIGEQTVTSIVTRSACRELGLKKGVSAYALVKATEVMLIRA